MKRIVTAAAAISLMLATAGGAWAQGNKTGHETDSGQGNFSNDNTNANTDNQGQTSVSGPKGQVDKGNYDCNNCTQDLPGANR